MSRRLLILAEREEGCRARLGAAGFAPEIAAEIAAYLSQSTDLVAFQDPIAEALRAIGVTVRFADPAEPSGWLRWLTEDPAATMVWAVTDGIRYYRGSAAPAMARLAGARGFGAPPHVQHLAQDKIKSAAVAAAFGLRVPVSGLMRGGEWLTPPPAGAGPWFVKPNTLGAKLGIWADSRVPELSEAAAVAQRIHERYRDDAVVQAYLPGRDIRVSYMAAGSDPGMSRLGVYRLDTGGGGETGGSFMTMADNFTLSGTADTEGGASASRSRSAAFVPRMLDLRIAEPELAAGIAAMVARLAIGIGLRDVFSADIRVTDDGIPHLLEFEVCPAVTIYDFRRYLADHWGCDLPVALAGAVAAAFGRSPDL